MGDSLTQERFTFFYDGPFSQWMPSPFTINGIRYPDAETFMMWSKDQMFGGHLEAKILANTHPAEAKKLGRMIKNFDPVAWNAVSRCVVFRGNIAKFTQNQALLARLFQTVGTTLVEASPVDKIWGIGLSEDNPLALDRVTWHGKNWLGQTLTEVRDSLLACRGSNLDFDCSINPSWNFMRSTS